MPDDTTAVAESEAAAAEAATTEAAKTFTQEQVNTFLAEQKRKIGDVKELKAAAAELATIKDAQKTTEQRAADRQAAADAEIATIPAKVSEALRVHLVALHKIPADRAELYLTATDPELLLKQVAGLVDLDADQKKHGNHVPREGNQTSAPENADLETVRALFGS